MSSGGSQPVQTQTQTKDPWAGAAPYLSDIYAKANTLQNIGSGLIPYQGPTVAGLDPQFAQTMANIYNLTNQQIGQIPSFPSGGIPGTAEANALGSTIIGAQGLMPQTMTGLNTLGGAGNTLTSALNTLSTNYGLYQNLANQNLTQQNPYLLAQIADQNRLAANKIQSSMSGAGRYGSGQYSDVMARAQAEVADPILAQDYLARQQLANAAISGMANTSGQIMGLAGQQANIGAQQAGLGFQGLNTAQQWAQALPQLYNQGLQAQLGLMQAQYQPYQMQMGLGQYSQDRAQQQLAGQVNLYNAQRFADWENLQRYAAILAGSGQLGGTQVASTTQQIPLAQRLLGGTIAGAGLGSIFGAPGAAIGALGGGLLGLA